MQHINDPRQTSLYDSFERVFSPLAYKRVQEGWQGVFRHCILELLPVEVLAKEFHKTLGRPTKELYSIAGLMFMMDFRNWTVEEAAEAYMFDTSVQYALNLEPALQSMASRTVERHLKVFREEDAAAVIMQGVTAALVRELELNVSKQRLDSTHVFSNMAVFGRTQMMGITIKRFLTQVLRHDPDAYEALPEELRGRYTPSASRLFGDTARDTESRRLLRQQVAEDMHWLIEHFGNIPAHAGRSSFKALARVFGEQCEVVQTQVKVKKKAGGRVVQNPSDPEATYDGKKGPGYQIQLSESCHEDNEVQLITTALPQTAADSDAESVEPVREQLKEQELLPKQMLSDTAYGSDANVQASQEEDMELVSPVNASRRKPDKLHVDAFSIDPETEEVQTCPAGHAPLESRHDPDMGHTRTYMDAQHCAQCPLQDQCPVQGKGARRSFQHTPAQRRGAQRYQNERKAEFKETYAKRAGIEGTIGRMKRCTGLGRLRVRGQTAVFHAIVLKAAGWNIMQAAKSARMRKKIAQCMRESANRLCEGHLGPLGTLFALLARSLRAWRTIKTKNKPPAIKLGSRVPATLGLGLYFCRPYL